MALAPDAVMYERGETIIEEGEPGQSAFIILSGEVEVYKTNRRGRVLVGRLGKNELIGEIGLFSDEEGEPVRSASVVAFTDQVAVIELGKEEFRAELEAMSPRMRMLVQAMIQRLRQTYTQIALLS